MEKAGFSQKNVKVWFESYSTLNALLFSSAGGGCVRTSASVCVSLGTLSWRRLGFNGEVLRSDVHSRETQKSPKKTTQR